jgi:hypothetical protein
MMVSSPLACVPMIVRRMLVSERIAPSSSIGCCLPLIARGVVRSLAQDIDDHGDQRFFCAQTHATILCRQIMADPVRQAGHGPGQQVYCSLVHLRRYGGSIGWRQCVRFECPPSAPSPE